MERSGEVDYWHSAQDNGFFFFSCQMQCGFLRNELKYLICLFKKNLRNLSGNLFSTLSQGTFDHLSSLKSL